MKFKILGKNKPNERGDSNDRNFESNTLTYIDDGNKNGQSLETLANAEK